MKKMFVILMVLVSAMTFVSAIFGEDKLPVMLNRGTYTAEPLPEYMDDIWVPYQEIRRLVFTDTRTGKQGIADEYGNVLIPADCPYIIDQRSHGTLQNTSGHYNEIICVNEPDDVWNGRLISLEKNEISYDGYFSFGGRDFITIMEYHDGMAIAETDPWKSGGYVKPKLGYVDKAGNLAIDLKFDQATNFEGGYAMGFVENKWGIIEKDGSFVFTAGAWRSIAHVHDRVFVGQAPSGKWYRIELPESSKQSKVAVDKSQVKIVKSDHGDTYIEVGKTSNVVFTSPMPIAPKAKSELKIDDKVQIVNTTALRMYQRPNWAPMDVQAFPGKVATVTDGPVRDGNTFWWEINFLGHKGWVIEVTGDGTRYLEKVK